MSWTMAHCLHRLCFVASFRLCVTAWLLFVLFALVYHSGLLQPFQCVTERASTPVVLHDLDKSAWIKWIEQHVQNPVRMLKPGYGTHRFVLMAALYLTQGPVFELGMGSFSTGLLGNISEATGRFVLSADHDLKWIHKLQSKHKARCHQFQHVMVANPEGEGENWAYVGTNYTWSVAFVDQKPARRRHVDVERLLNQSEVIVAHDTEESSNRMYLYRYVVRNSKYHYRWLNLKPQTTVLSNTRPDLIAGIKLLLKWITEEYKDESDPNTTDRSSPDYATEVPISR